MCGILDKDDFAKILRRKLGRDDVELVREEWLELSDEVEGFLGEHHILNLEYRIGSKGGVESFFVKSVPRRLKQQAEMIKRSGMFLKESFLYGFISEEFKKKGYDADFIAEFYLCKNDETIVLENLKTNDWKLLKKGSFFDLDHFKVTLKTVALLHANFVVYEEEKSKELGKRFSFDEENPRVFRETFFKIGDTGRTVMFIESSKECVKALLPLLDETDEWKKQLLNKISTFDCATVFHQDLQSRKTCGHGDLWSNNIMFKYSNGAPSQCCLLDYQLIRYFHPAYDVLLTICLNSSRDFRLKHLDMLLDIYYESFGEVLQRHGLDPGQILPKEDFLKSARALMPVAIFQMFSSRTMVLLPNRVTSNIIEEGTEAYTNFMYADRTQFVYESCMRDENFKKIFLDGIRDLYDVM